MNFSPGKLPGVWIVDQEPRGDARGSLTKNFCAEIFASQGLETNWSQQLSTFTAETGTIRGMHWQADPSPETKLIRCTRGRVFDVLVDIRPGSDTYGQWESQILSGDEARSLYAPGCFAHGLQTLAPNCEMNYLISAAYDTDLQRGFRWDDPEVGIVWLEANPILSERDSSLPLLIDVE
jgi:dTDP-4-dehydrorhamnose 3,5-epimerase